MGSMPISLRSTHAVLVVSIALIGGCGGGQQSSPSAPTAGTPSTAPSPQPTPTPSPSAPASAQSCRSLPPASGSPSGCAKGSPNFLNQVKGAVDQAVGAGYRDPHTGETFDVVRDNRIQVASAYLKTVIDALDREGLCAAWDGEEVNVRDGGGYNENYDIITADGRVWVNYNVTCRPALPLPAPTPQAPVRDPDCRGIPPSSFTFCVKETSSYDGDVYDAQDLLQAEDRARATPQVFDFGDRFSSSVPYGYKIANEPLYVSEMLKKLKAKGFCAIHDGEEFVVKRNGVYSEHFDMTRADQYAIRLYNSTCRDAAF